MRPFASLIVTVLLIPAMCMAQPGRHDRDDNRYRGDEQSALSIFSEQGDPFMLVLNGISQNTTPTTNIRVENLPQYVNDVEIIFADNHTPAIRRRINVSDPLDGRAVSMSLKIVRERDGDARLKFQKCTEIDHNYRPDNREYVMGYNQRGQGSGYVNSTPPPPPPPAPTAMDATSFEAAKNTIANAAFDDTKLSTAKSILASNYLNTDQVIIICKLLAYDDSKLDFAKAAYKKTVDNTNYFKVTNVFSFDSNKEALNDYLNSNR